jgi:hypothetical protein
LSGQLGHHAKVLLSGRDQEAPRSHLNLTPAALTLIKLTWCGNWTSHLLHVQNRNSAGGIGVWTLAALASSFIK